MTHFVIGLVVMIISIGVTFGTFMQRVNYIEAKAQAHEKQFDDMSILLKEIDIKLARVEEGIENLKEIQRIKSIPPLER